MVIPVTRLVSRLMVLLGATLIGLSLLAFVVLLLQLLLLLLVLPFSLVIVLIVHFDDYLLLTRHFDAFLPLLGNLVRVLGGLPLILIDGHVLQLRVELVSILLVEVHFHGLLESTLRLVSLVLLAGAGRRLHYLHLTLICNLNSVLLLVLALFDPIILTVASLMRFQVNLLVLVIKLVVLDNLTNDLSDVLFISHLLQNSGNPVELSVRHVIVPTGARNSVLGLKEVRDRRVVNDYNIGHGSAQSSQVLHESIVEVGAVLAEQLVPAVAFRVQLADQRLGVF